MPRQGFLAELLAVMLMGGIAGALAAIHCLPVSHRTEVDLLSGRVRTGRCCMGVYLEVSITPAVVATAADGSPQWRLCEESHLYRFPIQHNATDLQLADRLLLDLLPAMASPATNPWRGPGGGFDGLALDEIAEHTLSIMRSTENTDDALAFLCRANRELAILDRAATAKDVRTLKANG